ncbi:hypothetical protein D3C78_1524600 [compost metagenome]
MHLSLILLLGGIPGLSGPIPSRTLDQKAFAGAAENDVSRSGLKYLRQPKRRHFGCVMALDEFTGLFVGDALMLHGGLLPAVVVGTH